MYTRQYKTKKTSANVSDTTNTNQFAPRRFVVQAAKATNNQAPGLQTQLDKKKSSGNSWRNITVTPSNFTQPQSPRIQMQLNLSQPGDKQEQEANKVAADVMQGNAPTRETICELDREASVQMLQRQTDKATTNHTATITTDLANRIQTMRGGGQALSKSTRNFFEPRFGYDLSSVRVHTNSQANEAANQLNAQAFTLGRDIFFAAGHYQPQTTPGKFLLAHELTHTLQQQPQKTQQKSSNKLVTYPPLTVNPITNQIQRFPGINKTLNWVAGKATNIPGFTLLTVIIGRNPINNQPVEQNAINLTRGIMGLIPGGDLIFKALQENGILERVFSWLKQQIGELNLTWDSINALFTQAWSEISILDGLNGAFNKIKEVFFQPYLQLKNFAVTIGEKVINFIKEAILQPVAQLAQTLPGYRLLSVILGKDPITGEVVERNANNFIGGILSLVPGGQEIFHNLQESGAIEKAATWLNQEINNLGCTWQTIQGLFTETWDALVIEDITNPSQAFAKIRHIFHPQVQRVEEFAIAFGPKALEFVFEGALQLGGPLASIVLEVIQQAGAAFSSIVNDPVAFAGNLVKAIQQGLYQFSENILIHLKTGLTTWLFGALAAAGINLPEEFNLKGIVSLVLQILGLTYANLRSKLVDLIGEEPVVYMEETFDFLVAIATEGLTAAWEKIVEFTGSLEEMFIGGIRDWVSTNVVTQAITKLASLFSPAGAIIQSVISIYNTLTFFMERSQQIAALVNAVTKSIDSVAAGAIGLAANFIEMSMSQSTPVMLGFLSNFIGFGNIIEPIQKVIQGLQEKVWGAIDQIANIIAVESKSLLGFRQGKDNNKNANTSASEKEKQAQAGMLATDNEEQEDTEVSTSLNILFSGSSDTDKVMAAEVIAKELKFNFYKIDLSQVTSKDIEEPEKNLDQIFANVQTSNAILFFEEADALFGKTSEVKDKHNSHVHLGTDYVMQKIEEHEGIAILATDSHQNLHETLVKTCHFTIEFPFANDEYGKRMLEKIFVWEYQHQAMQLSAELQKKLLT